MVASLNPRESGGAERAAPVTQARTATNEAVFVNGLEHPPLMSRGGSNGIPNGLGRITRDETGQVVTVETGDELDSPLSPQRGLVAAAATLSPERQSWVSLGHMSRTKDPKIDIIQGECETPGSFWR